MVFVLIVFGSLRRFGPHQVLIRSSLKGAFCSRLLTTEKLMADHMHDESQGGLSCCAQGSCATHDHNDVAIHDHSHGHGLPITIQYCSG